MNELPFRPDFTARVFADVRRRRSSRRLAVAAAAVLMLGGVVTIAALRPVPTATPAAPALAELDVSAFDEVRTEPIDYMFPQAASLAAFSESYVGANTPDTPAVFADIAEDEGS